MRVAIVYDRINKWGGAERVLLALHELFPDAPLFTSVYHKDRARWAGVFRIIPSFLQQMPFAKTAHEYYAPFMLPGFESFSFDNYDVVISVSSEAAKGVVTKPTTLHICYCLTPTRYLWSGYNDYFTNHLLRILAKPFVSLFRYSDLISSNRPDVYIAISKEVQRRIKKYYNKESIVIYPPVEISSRSNRDKSQISNKKNKSNNKDFFLIVSRFVSYKRIDVAIEAFNKLALPLKIVGVGALERKLKSLAGPTIEFLQNLTDAKLGWYYTRCVALVFPGIEDFGLTIVEAQRFGKPVIAFKAGGAIETILEGKTGEFFFPQTVDALMETIKRFTKKTYNKTYAIAQAEKFNKKQFQKTFLSYIEQLYKQKKDI